MISRRALFAGAAGAVVAASPMGRALGAPVDSRAEAFTAMMRLVQSGPSYPLYIFGASVAEMWSPDTGWRTVWRTRSELLEKYPNAD